MPTLTWVSDIAAVLHAGFKPVFVDIDPRTLGMDNAQVLEKVTPRTRAVFLTHVLGYNALSDELLDGLASRGIPLIEDVCESHGATFEGRKLGTFGLASNFSFYYAHHLSTIEGGMVSTNDSKLYEYVRMFRSHGMVRESTSQELRQSFETKHPDLTPEFIFAFPGYNVRSTEINAVIGRSQLGRLDDNNVVRARICNLFLDNLDPAIYRTDFETEGELQLRLHPGVAESGYGAARQGDGCHAPAWRGVSARHLGRRQSAAPAVSQETCRRGGGFNLSACGPRALFRLLHRKLSWARTREDP